MLCPVGCQAVPLLFHIFTQEVLVYLIGTGSEMGGGGGGASRLFKNVQNSTLVLLHRPVCLDYLEG